MKLAVFDFDSTLINGETIDFLAKECGVENEVAKITASAMQGEIDFYESLKKRVGLLKGLPYTQAKEICENLPLHKGAKQIIQTLHKKDYKVVCFSGGFSLATRHFAKVLELDADFSNILHTKNDTLSGEVGGEMMFSYSKGDMLVRLQNLLHISQQDTLCVGDGANDLSMFAHSGIKIAFCAKEILKQNADIIIDEPNLCAIEKFLS